MCPFKTNNIANDPDIKCVVPDARARSMIYDMPVMSEEVLDKMDAETLNKIKELSEGIDDFKTLHNSILNKKKLDYPKVNRIEVLNLNITLDEKEEDILRLLEKKKK